MIDCPIENPALDYRERLVIHDGPFELHCCETGKDILAGEVYAECQLFQCDGYDGEPEWESYPQRLRVWRWARGQREKGNCFPFQGIDEQLDALERDDDDWLVCVAWERTKKHDIPGSRVRLSACESAAVASGAWYSWVGMRGGRNPNYGSTEKPTDPGGELWHEGDGQDELRMEAPIA